MYNISFLMHFLTYFSGFVQSFMCPSGINDFPMTNSTHIKVCFRPLSSFLNKIFFVQSLVFSLLNCQYVSIDT